MKNPSRNELLFNAVAKWDIVKTKELLNAGANIKSKYAKSWEWGCLEKYVGCNILDFGFVGSCNLPKENEVIHDMIALLIENGACPRNSDIIIWATKYTPLKTIKLLVENNANLDYKSSDGLSVLHAIDYDKDDSLEKLQYFINNGVDVNSVDANDRNCLYHLSNDSHLEHAKLLINEGIDINNTDTSGHNILHFLARHFSKVDIESSQSKLIQLLIDAGANPHVFEKQNHTPLMLASQSGNIGIVKVLLKNKVNVNQQYKDKNGTGDTALMLATDYYINWEIVEILRKAGANPNLVKGKTACWNMDKKDLEKFKNITKK